MELCLGKMAYDVQDVEMFELIKGFHTKAISKFMEAVGDKLTINQKYLVTEGLVRVTLSNSLRTSGGNARGGMFITLNYRLLKENKDDLEWIYVHELAHIICQRLYPTERGHGKIWKRVNSLLGFEPKRTHRLDTSCVKGVQRRHTYHCGCQEHSITTAKRNKILKGASYVCKTCKGKLVDAKSYREKLLEEIPETYRGMFKIS